MSLVVPVSQLLRHAVGYCTSHTEFNQLIENLSVWKNHHGQGDGVLLYMTIETVNAEH